MPRPQFFVFFYSYFKDKHFTYLCAKSLQAYVCYNFSIKVIAKRMGWHSNKSENTGITSVDRSTKATLSTYNPWIQVSRLQNIHHCQHKKWRGGEALVKRGRRRGAGERGSQKVSEQSLPNGTARDTCRVNFFGKLQSRGSVYVELKMKDT